MRIALLAFVFACAASAQVGLFEGHGDVGPNPRPGAAAFDAASGAYRITGGGENMWFASDAFHFAWKRMEGGVSLTADVRFEGSGGNAHRKAGWMIRQSLDPDSPYADAVVHGDGLTSLQYRETRGGETREVKAAITAPSRIRLERRGNTYTLWAAKAGEALRPLASIALNLADPVYVGLAVCSHDANALETAVFSSVAMEPVSIEMKPYAMDWRANAGGLSSVASLLEAPAGKDGFITVRDGHLATGTGKRFRIWGMNFTAASTTPSKADAPAVADHLARFGINCVRFHFLDRPAPAGLIDATRSDTRALDAAQLDRFDYFVSELKKRGIYTNINLNVARTYKPGDGVREAELLGFAKALTYFDQRLLFLQREYARQLLTHRNPYTKTEYRNEPAVAIVELVNENSIVESWRAGRLLGNATRPNPGTWTDIPASYEKALTELYGGQRLKPAEFPSATADRFAKEAAFYMDLEDSYFQSMRKLLKEELGVKALLVATSDHNHGMSGYPLLRSASKLDVVDGHVYWQHPRYLDEGGFEIGNTPMVQDPLHSTVVQLSRSAVAGKPYTVSEVNHPFPAEYACEGIPILTAYAAFHDWDGIFWYTFEHSDPQKWTPRQPRHFEFRPDPVKMSQIAAGALLFLRGDVSPARETVTRSYAAAEIYESLRLPPSERPYFTPGFPLVTPLKHATRIASFDGPATRDFTADKGPQPYVTDTSEIAWGAGLVTVDTRRSQAAAGFCSANSVSLTNLGAAIENPFCALTLSSLDAEPIGASKRLLLTATARAANTDMRWNAARTSLTDWGKEPTVIEPVTGTITLKSLAEARGVEVAPLDGGGRPIGPAIRAVKTAGGWEFPIGKTVTPWYGIIVMR